MALKVCLSIRGIVVHYMMVRQLQCKEIYTALAPFSCYPQLTILKALASSTNFAALLAVIFATIVNQCQNGKPARDVHNNHEADIDFRST